MCPTVSGMFYAYQIPTILMATKNFSNILSSVCTTDLEYQRVNDVIISNDEYSLQLAKNPNDANDTLIYLVGEESGERFRISVYQLAALRMFEIGRASCRERV